MLDGATCDWSDEEKAFVARFLVGSRLCTSHGETREEAFANLTVAVEAMRDVLAAMALVGEGTG